MAYTPELSARGSGILRRLAWASGQPMTKTLAKLVAQAAQNSKPGKVCCSCRDKSKCSICGFNPSLQSSQK